MRAQQYWIFMKQLKFIVLIILLFTGVTQAQTTRIWNGTYIADVTSGKALKTDSSATIQPVSGTLTCNIGTLNGLATAAKQDTGNTSLSSIDGKITACNTGAVVVTSGSITCNAGTNLNTSALATSAKQDTGNTSLSSIDGKITACNTGATVVSSIVPGTGATNLGKAEDSASSGGDTGVAFYGIRNDALASNVGSDADYGPPVIDKSNRLIFFPFAPVEARITGTATTTGTSDTSLVAASGNAGLKTYITDCQFANTGSTTALITLKDGSGGTTLAYTIAPTGGGSNIKYDTPLMTTANTALYFAAGSSSTTIYGSCQGFKAP